jgi:hypothetical protein
MTQALYAHMNNKKIKIKTTTTTKIKCPCEASQALETSQ